MKHRGEMPDLYVPTFGHICDPLMDEKEEFKGTASW
jgi:hypothetical protein